MAVAATRATVIEGVPRRALADALAAVARHLPLYAIVGLVIGVHVHTLHRYFFGDDFLVLGDARAHNFPDYMRDVILLRDMTPNWRPLTMAVYYGEFRLFGLDPMPWRIVNLGVHVATVILLYALVLSITKRVFVASATALIFGISASAVHTVTYVTAFPHVLSELLLVASLSTMHNYVQGGERRAAWFWSSFVLYVLGFLANEGGVVMGIVICAYYILFSYMKRRDALEAVLKMTPFALAATLLVAGLAGSGRQGVDSGFYGVGWHIPRETWIYLARLAYPVGAIRIQPRALEWTIGSIVAGSAIFFLLRGPHIARVAAIGMVVALMPYAPGKIWTATRYTYMALPFFGLLVAIAAGFVFHHLVRLNRPIAYALAAAALVTVGGLYAWQTNKQTDPFLENSDRWELLATELHEQYPDVTPGTTVYVVDDEGLWTNAFWQPTWMTSVGRALWGDDRAVRALPSNFIEPVTRGLDPSVYLVVEYRNGHLRKVSPASVTQPTE
jgi:hypothetical protein